MSAAFGGRYSIQLSYGCVFAVALRPMAAACCLAVGIDARAGCAAARQ